MVANCTIIRALGALSIKSFKGVALGNQGLEWNGRDQPYGRSLVLYMRTQVLMKQLEDLRKLRERLRKAEAMALGQRRYAGRRLGARGRRVRTRWAG